MSSKKIVEDWIAKYGNNPEVDKIVNERVEYMTNKQLTAVEWLESEIKKIRNIIPKVLFEKAKQMEKEQITKAANDADDSDFWVKYESFEQYYNNVYGKDKSND